MSIKVDAICKVYDHQDVLKNISFEVEKPEIVGFLGPNGAGKSTLMKILTTYISPSYGSAWVNGYDVAKEPLQVQKSIGYLPEHNPLYEDMYVREYLKFNASIYGSAASRVENVIEQTGLATEVHKKIGALSKGFKQRVGLAQALLHDPEVLILDEPTTGLDPNQLVEIRALITSLGSSKTVFLSTHIMQEVEAMCERVIIINKGEIVLDKPLKDLRKNQNQIIVVEFDYRVEEAFLKALPKVKNVKNTHDFVYEITFSTAKDMAY